MFRSKFASGLVAMLVVGLSASNALATSVFTWTAPTDFTPTALQTFLLGIVGPYMGPLMGLGLLITTIWTVYRVVRGGVRKRA